MDRARMKRVHFLTILVSILAHNTVQADPTVSGRNKLHLKRPYFIYHYSCLFYVYRSSILLSLCDKLMKIELMTHIGCRVRLCIFLLLPFALCTLAACPYLPSILIPPPHPDLPAGTPSTNTS